MPSMGCSLSREARATMQARRRAQVKRAEERRAGKWAAERARSMKAKGW